mmetsp:Transcript_101855/g.311522  ORF Transcript_101855/g.311522 Transcript_101855/m.311522 type:complete len:481 (-) Transcript_101855:10-1452(-)
MGVNVSQGRRAAGGQATAGQTAAGGAAASESASATTTGQTTTSGGAASESAAVTESTTGQTTTGGAPASESVTETTKKSENDDTSKELASSRVLDRGGPSFSDVYFGYKPPEHGTLGARSRAIHKDTGVNRAVKTLSMARMDRDRVEREVAIMRLLDHPNIVKLCDTFLESELVYLVEELTCGGGLFDRICAEGRLGEVQASHVLRQVVLAVRYMHGKRVCHRGVEPGSLSFSAQPTDPIDSEKNVLKFVDFESACMLEPGQFRQSKVGSPHFVAPEVLQGKYSHPCDMWSTGVLLFLMLCGQAPFSGKSDSEVLAQVKRGNVSFDGVEWKAVSEDAKGLVSSLLEMDSARRYTAEQALEHDWVKKAPDVTLPASTVGNLRAFHSHTTFEKVALAAIARQLDEAKIADLRLLFGSLDRDGDGRLTAAEMKEGIQGAGLKEVPSDLEEILQSIDADASGDVEYTEFLTACIAGSRRVTQET